MTGAAAAATVSSVAASIALASTPSSASVIGSSNAVGPANVTTASVTITPTGGVAPYAHAWTQLGTSTLTWTIGTPAGATTSFTATNEPEGTSEVVTFKDTVTDAAGNVATKIITATARHYSGGVL